MSDINPGFADAVIYDLRQLFRRHRILHHPVAVMFGVPRYFNRQTGALMPASLTLPFDQQVVVPLVFTDAAGATVPAPTGGSAVASDVSLVNASLAADDTSVTVVPLQPAGTVEITYTNGALTDTLTVTLAAATTAPTSVAFDVTHATFSPKA